jgi:hypothetical protein
MTTKLTTTIRREIEIDGEPYTVIISPDGLRLTRKRFRSGIALSWKALRNQRATAQSVRLSTSDVD